MDTIFIDTETSEALDEWGAENRDYVRIDSFYFTKCKVVVKDLDIECYVEHTKKNKIRIKYNSTTAAKVEFVRDGILDNDYTVKVQKLNPDFPDESIKSCVATYLLINGYLFFGNLVENKTVKTQGKNDGEDKVIVFRKSKGKVYAINVGSHRSPEGVFSVRGHLRHYKSGKNIWIEEYVKGGKD